MSSYSCSTSTSNPHTSSDQSNSFSLFDLESQTQELVIMKFPILGVDRIATLAFLATYFSALSLAAPAVENLAIEKRALPVLMGLAKSFGALGATTLTSTGATAITGTGGVGNGGTWPGTAIIGFPPGTASGVLAPGTVLAQNGEAACLTAYNKYVILIPAKQSDC